MKIEELAERLRHISMDVGTLTCLGCGHEHNCGTSGCAVLQEAADALEDKLKRTPLTADELKDMVYAAGRPVVVWTVCIDPESGEPEDWEEGEWDMFDGRYFSSDGCGDVLENYGTMFVAYRDGEKIRPPRR